MAAYYKEVSREVVAKAVKRMKGGKATGFHEIPVKAWKTLGIQGITKFSVLMAKIWRCKPFQNIGGIV